MKLVVQRECDILGDTIHQQSSHSVVTIVDSNHVTSLIELVSAGESSRPGPDDRDLLPRAELGRVWLHPSHLEALRHKY